MSIYKTVNRLIIQSKKATPEQLALLIDRASAAPFAGDLLEADESLWGSFWQGDVIAPGYLLPAAELALLRATRLDRTWPEDTSLPHFLADLHQAIRHPQAGVWTLQAAGVPCVVFASVSGQRSAVGGRPMATVVWYCATTDQLHAGYRTPLDRLHFAGAIEMSPVTRPEEPLESPTWLKQAAEQAETADERSLATRLDAAILRHRYQMGRNRG